DRLKEELIPFIAAARSSVTPSIKGHFPAALQRELSREILRRFGYDETSWRLDTAPHPFATSLGTADIRITTRELEDSLDGLFATMHECGHGLYESGVDPALQRTLLARGASLGLHEAMSHYLGVDVPDDAHGVLQDKHWSRGNFGYFPTYSLGNVISVQIWERMREDIADLDEQMGRGEFAALGEWLREHLYRHGRK